ncbi:chromosome partitioning protein [Fodinibius roseus]|uniref:Chromosome partitioning protein n=1 Tax=Fodinibius roseus TaxID=1194090 RepID=A0A1M4X2N2_9BACT|nr:ParA family protein [Fodinibius roseus]SHE87741.1 chromosome partitioning protein [Fodinibius roseus]
MNTRIAITNQKGGVAKTTTAVNLADGLQRLGRSVLLVDSDPQANATSHLGIDRKRLRKTMDNLYYEADLDISEVLISRNGFTGLDVLPAGEPLAYAEQKLSGVPVKEKLLSERLAEIEGNYDYIIIDCPPNLGFLTMNALVAATDMLVVIKPEYFALEGLMRISQKAEMIKQRINPDLNLSGYLLANYDGRKNQHKAIRKAVKEKFPGKLFQTIIRTNARLSNATSQGQTIFEYDPKSHGATDYRNLSTEVEERYGRR